MKHHTIDVRKIRRNMVLTREEFASRFCLELATVKEWEQGRRHPSGAAWVLLKLIERNPDAIDRALGV